MVRYLRKRIRRSLRRLRAADRHPTWLDRLAAWNRNQLARIAVIVVVAWFVGGVGFYLAERRVNPEFSSLPESFWKVWVVMFSGLDNPPQSRAGKFLAMVLLGTGMGLAGLFTGTIASILVEHQLRRRTVASYEMEGHLVLCNWASRGLQWVREVHSKIIHEKRVVVIIHDDPDSVDLPDKQDDPAFHDVYMIKGDPTSEVILRRARVGRAHSIVVLADDRQGEHADGKTILTCIAIRNIARAGEQPNIAVECRNPNNAHHLRRAGADEIISSDEFGLRLLARAAMFHGVSRVYQELLTVSRDANELYNMKVPADLVGRDFIEIASMFLRHRNDKRSCLLIGIQRGEEVLINPIGGEAGPVRADDELILLSRVFIQREPILPTDPPIQVDSDEPSA